MTRYRAVFPNRYIGVRAVALWLVLVVAPLSWSADLEPDRADVLYHRYEGDNATIDGPALLVRKRLGKQFAVTGKYYVDSVSSASIDVVLTASPYTEERKEAGLGVEYVNGKTRVTAGASNSDEHDFTARSAYFAVTQDLFGDLTTVTLSYGRGDDQVRRVNDDNFEEDVDRQIYGLGISQIITPKLILGTTIEGITDEGYLNNPYRRVRYVDPTNAQFGYSFQDERYPDTRSSIAVALRGRYFLDYRAAVHGEYRYFTDTWDIVAHTAEIGYTQPWRNNLIFEARLRTYRQSEASFYSDLFSRVDEQNFLARDKELSRFSNTTLRLGVSYQFAQNGWGILDRGSVNLTYDRIAFDYENFRNAPAGGPVGEEPLFAFDANVVQVYFSFWY
ncbi:MAG: DUF3570 domain-containing protein [Pseudomonadota bacterium]